MSTVATTITDRIFIILDERNDEGSEFALVPMATIRIVAHHGELSPVISAPPAPTMAEGGR
jgi:hypothetical protein